MSAGTARISAPKRSAFWRPNWALAAIAVMGIGFAPRPVAAQSCVGDCKGAGSVDISDLIIGVNIALGLQPVTACPAFEHDGTVDITRLIEGVNNALNGCGATPVATDTPGGVPTPTSVSTATTVPTVPMITLSGSCAAPGSGSHGLKPCDAGTPITVLRCDDPSQCLHQQGLTMVGATTVADSGGWSVQIAMADAGAALVFQASITNAVVYRTLGFGLVGGSLRAAVASDLTFAPADITPVTEAAVQLLDTNGFQNYSDTGAQQVLSAVEQATATLDFANSTADGAVLTALQTAGSDPTVMVVLVTARNTPTPTGTLTSTPADTATAAPTPSTTATTTPIDTQTPTVTLPSTPSNTATATKTPSATATATPTNTTPTATPTTPGGRFVDNGDGTITDNQTGLIWEKKVGLDGTLDAANLHDADNQYTWAGECSLVNSILCQPNAAAAAACAKGATGDQTGCAECPPGLGTCNVVAGALTTIWDWLAQLNAGTGFARQSDWRVSTLEELESIADYTRANPAVYFAFNGANCGGACPDLTDASCSCTSYNFNPGNLEDRYLYLSSDARDAGRAWGFGFSTGPTKYFDKFTPGSDIYDFARAVRGGSATPTPTPRYVDNTDGTITDRQTRLVWEKKVALDGRSDFANLHDADNTYPWAGGCTNTGRNCQPTLAALTVCILGVYDDHTACDECTANNNDGTCNVTDTIWTWVIALNAANFAGHADWRVPSIQELASLMETSGSPPLVDAAFQGANCGGSCTDVKSPDCSCTQPNAYWSASSYLPFGNQFAWYLNFGGETGATGFSLNTNVRAVRGGS